MFAGGDSNLYGYVLGDPVNLVDPWGLFYSPSLEYGKPREYTQWQQGAYEMWRTYWEMRKANTQLSDKYFHCLANCRATNIGKYGKSAAERISDFREWYQEPFDGAEACEEDQKANRQGRKGGNCAETCKIFKPNGLPAWVEQ